MAEEQSISAEYPFESHYVDVFGTRMHYIEEGEGDPIIFLHGVPTWSYLWRNIIPTVSEGGRCIAPDLIGFGKSDKPDIDYTVFDHIKYFDAFIESLQLKNITLVMHGWGSVIGFDYAMRHPDNIKGLAFFEAHLRSPDNPQMLSLPVQEISHLLDNPEHAYDVIMNSNYYLNKVLPSGVLRHLTDKEMSAYQQPFLRPGSCKPIWQYLQDLPKGDQPSQVSDLIAHYSEALTKSQIKKLLLFAVPGFITTIDTVTWANDHFPQLTLVDLDEALHYAQESNPQHMANAILEWQRSL